VSADLPVVDELGQELGELDPGLRGIGRPDRNDPFPRVSIRRSSSRLRIDPAQRGRGERAPKFLDDLEPAGGDELLDQLPSDLADWPGSCFANPLEKNGMRIRPGTCVGRSSPAEAMSRTLDAAAGSCPRGTRTGRRRRGPLRTSAVAADQVVAAVRVAVRDRALSARVPQRLVEDGRCSLVVDVRVPQDSA